MRQIIKSESVSNAQILADLEEYKQSLPNYDEIKLNTPSSTLMMVDDLIAGFGSWLNYKYQMERKESFLSTAERESSILNISSMLGYNTNRATSPILTFQYNAIPTRALKHGTVIGTLEDGTPITYFGNSKFIEKGDLIQFCVGYFNSISPTSLASFPIENGNYKYVAIPTLAKSIDNQHIKIYVGNKELSQTRDPEVYVVGPLPKVDLLRVETEEEMLSLTTAKIGAIVYREDLQKYFVLEEYDYTNPKSWVEFLNSGSISIDEYAGAVLNYSLNLTTAVMYLTNREYYQGAKIGLSDSIEITWIETNGYMYLTPTSLVNYDQEWSDLTLITVNSYGTNGDSLAKIKQLAPMYNTTLRRAVTEKDHKYLLEANEYMLSVEVEKDLGVSEEGTVNFTPLNIGDTITIKLGDVHELVYPISSIDTFEKTSPTIQTVQEKISYLLNVTGLVHSEVNADQSLKLKIHADSRIEYTEFVNVTYTQIVKGVRPACCTINVFYIKHDTIDIPKLLSEYEQKLISDYMVKYKMVGSTMKLIPAAKSEYEIKVQVKLTSPSLQYQVYTEIRKILDSYELLLNKGFSYGEFMARAAQITIDPDGNGTKITPIIYILPDQVTFNVSEDKTKYLKFIFNESHMNVVP